MNKIVCLFIIFIQFNIYSQSAAGRFILFFGGDYITSAQIFPNPKSSDVIIRNESFEIKDLYSPVVELKYYLTDELLFGFATEVITKTTTGFNETIIEGSQLKKIEVEDGVSFIPLELAAYYEMPFSTEEFMFTMGGGIGYYLGSHSRTLGDAKLENIEKNNSFGLLISVGMEYKFYEHFGFRFDMKFRDPENTITSKYDRAIANYRERQLLIQQTEFDTKINLNGISFLFGITYHF